MEMMAMLATAGGEAATAAGVTGTAATLASTASTFGTILSAVGGVASGIGQKKEANFEATQMNIQGKQDRAAADRTAIDDLKQKDLAQSRLQAVSAASGGGATDPTVIDMAGDIEKRGEYNALTDIYNGDEQARGLQVSAAAKKAQGQMALTSGLVGAAGTILDGATSLYGRFATKKPVSSSYYPQSKYLG